MACNFGDKWSWFKGLSLLKKIIYIAAVVLSTIGLVGFLGYYSAWRGHYYWMYTEDAREIQDKLKDICDDLGIENGDTFYKNFKNLIVSGLSFAVIAAGCFVAVVVFWVIFDCPCIWKIIFFSALACCGIAVACGYSLAGITGEKYDLLLFDIKKCYVINVIDAPFVGEDEVKKLTKSKIKQYGKNITKWCQESNDANVTLSTFLAVGAILDLVAFFFL